MKQASRPVQVKVTALDRGTATQTILKHAVYILAEFEIGARCGPKLQKASVNMEKASPGLCCVPAVPDCTLCRQ